MKNSKILKIYLIVTGLLLTVIGGTTFFTPIASKAGEGIDIANNVNMLNDTRAFGAFVLALATLSFIGAFVKRMKFTASLVIPLFLLTVGIGRIASTFLDGTPSDALFKAIIVELVLGTLGLVFFKLFQEKNNQ